MAKKTPPSLPQPADAGGDDFAPVKVRRSTYRLVKLAAAWKDESILDYLDRAVRAYVEADLRELSKTLGQEIDRLLG